MSVAADNEDEAVRMSIQGHVPLKAAKRKVKKVELPAEMRAKTLPPVSRPGRGKKGAGSSMRSKGAMKKAPSIVSSPTATSSPNRNMMEVVETVIALAKALIEVVESVHRLAKSVDGTMTPRQVAAIFDGALLPYLSSDFTLAGGRDSPTSSKSSTRPLGGRKLRGSRQAPSILKRNMSDRHFDARPGSSHSSLGGVNGRKSMESPLHDRASVTPSLGGGKDWIMKMTRSGKGEDSAARVLALICLLEKDSIPNGVDLSGMSLAATSMDVLTDALLSTKALGSMRALRISHNHFPLDAFFAVAVIVGNGEGIHLGAPIEQLFLSHSKDKNAKNSVSGGGLQLRDSWEDEDEFVPDVSVPDQLVRGLAWMYYLRHTGNDSAFSALSKAVNQLKTVSDYMLCYFDICSKFLESTKKDDDDDDDSDDEQQGESSKKSKESEDIVIPKLSSSSGSTSTFRHLKCAEEVDLSGVALTSVAIDVITALFRLPTVCKSIRVLRMRKCGVDDSKLFSLQSILHHSYALEYWDLRDNQISELSANALLQRIKEKGRRHLRLVDFDGNKCLTSAIKVYLYRLFLARTPNELHPSLERAVLEVFSSLRPYFEQRISSGIIEKIDYEVEPLSFDDLQDEEQEMAEIELASTLAEYSKGEQEDVKGREVRRFTTISERYLHLGVALRDLVDSAGVRTIVVRGNVSKLTLPIVVDLCRGGMEKTNSLTMLATFESACMYSFCLFALRTKEWEVDGQKEEGKAVGERFGALAKRAVGRMTSDEVDNIVSEVPLTLAEDAKSVITRCKCDSVTLRIPDNVEQKYNSLLLWSCGFLRISGLSIYSLSCVSPTAVSQHLASIAKSATVKELKLYWEDDVDMMREERRAPDTEGLIVLTDETIRVSEGGSDDSALVEAAAILPKTLQSAPKLTVLSLCDCPIKILSDVWLALKSLRSLTELCLNDCVAISVDGIDLQNDKAYESSLISPSITRLEINDSVVLPSFGAFLDHLQYSSSRGETNVIRFSCRGMIKGANDTASLKKASTAFFKTVETFDIGDNPLEGEALRSLAKYSKCLRAVAFSGCRVLPERNIAYSKSIVKCCVGLEDILRLEKVEEVWLDGVGFVIDDDVWQSTIIPVLEDREDLTLVTNDLAKTKMTLKLSRDYPELAERVLSVSTLIAESRQYDTLASAFLFSQ
uniref:Uncharacterized protein n=1 Tax=Palpitomonas bilix TaxID=652834 RepID=A0A7S3DAF9_9EUKA